MTVQKSLPPSGRRVSYSPTPRVAPYLAAEFVDKIVSPGPGYPNNILKTTALPATVKVSVPWNDDFYADDILILEWDGVRVTSSSYTITPQDEADKKALILDLPLTTSDDYDQTPHQLRYIIDWSDAGADSFGENQDSWVDTTAPGSPVLGRLTFPSVSPGDPLVITLDSLDTSDNLIGLVPSYNGEWQGDLIEVYIETAGVKTWLTPGTRLPAGPIGIQPPSVAFSLAALEAAGDQDVHLLGYRVTDLAGNVSALSQEVAARFVLNDIPMNVPAPTVPLFDDNGIVDEADARVLIAEIPPITPVHVNDEIVLKWGTQVVARDFITNTAADPLLRLPIPYSAVLNGGGAGNPTRYTTVVEYDVLRDGVYLTTSLKLINVFVDVTLPGGPDPDPTSPEHGELLEASVLSTASGAVVNVISAGQYTQPANVTVPWPTAEDFAVGDLVTVFWKGVAVTTLPRAVTQAEFTSKTLQPFPLTPAQIATGGAGQVPLSYTVTRRIGSGNGYPPVENTSRSKEQIVQVTSPSELPGGGSSLPIGAFQDLNSSGYIDRCNSERGMVYRVPLTYANAAVGDLITITFRGLEGTTGTTELAGTRYEVRDDVGGTELAQGFLEFRVLARFLAPDLYPLRRNRAEVSHTARNVHGEGSTNPPSYTPVTMVGQVCPVP